MAERVAPPGENSDPENNEPPSTDPPPFVPGTYVVQVPKEQIYRFPTEENAKLAEKYRNPTRRRRPCLSFFIRFCSCLLVIAVLLGLVAAIIYFAVNPKPPQITIDRVRVWKPSIRLNKHQRHNPSHPRRYDISLTFTNTNKQMEFSYRKGGTADLLYGEKEIASGEPQPISGSQRSASFKLPLSESAAQLPEQIQKSLRGKGPRGGLKLSLSVVIPVRLKVVGVSFKNMKVVGQCDLKVSKLAKPTRVLSQRCNVKLA